jgi:hypothetical protein
MRFMIIRRADDQTEAGGVPKEEVVTAMLAYQEEMMKAGVFRDGRGLKPSSYGARVKIGGGEAVVTDGPFAETKELIAGFTMIEAGSREEALEWVKKWPQADNAELELRQVMGLEDFADAIAPELIEQDERMRAEGASKD